MDQRLSQTISNTASWDDLKQLESNIREKGRFDDEVAAAIKARGADLGRTLVAERTGLNVSNLSPAEEKIVQAVSEYVSVMRQQRKYPQRTFEQLGNRGLIGAAESAVSRPKPTQGLKTLIDAELEELSYEQIVIDHSDEFSPRALWYSRRTLGLPTDTDTPPTTLDSDTQTRTATLVAWLKVAAQSNGGVVPPFSNAEAGEVMGMGDLRHYGQAHGNIQSRIDFACYLSGLPPLGLLAEAPFQRAWSQQQRDWAFPIRSMQRAAQGRTWTSDEFDRVLRQTEQLSGLTHTLWKDALVNDEARVKGWAQSFGEDDVDRETEGVEGGDSDREQKRQRNPDWTRDELILALDLYIRRRPNLPVKDSAEVAALSDLLNQLGLALGGAVSGTLRNASGVYMKLMNFRRFDLQYTADGKVGLQRGNKDEQSVWTEFARDPDRLAAVAEAIRSAVEAKVPAENLVPTMIRKLRRRRRGAC